MKKVAVVFHSICGNTYQIAKHYKDVFDQENIECSLFRVKDDSYESLSTQFESSLEYKDKIEKIKIIDNTKEFEKFDAVFIGSPTYFGTVSMQIKGFLDSFLKLWINGNLKGKYFGSFATCSDKFGGGSLTLQTLNTFAQHMAMIPISVPSILVNYNQPAYGILHVTGEKADIRISNKEKEEIKNYLKYFIKITNLKG